MQQRFLLFQFARAWWRNRSRWIWHLIKNLFYIFDVLVVCESRHLSADDVAVRRSIPKGYNIVEAARDPTTDRFGHDKAPRGAPGGGLVIYHREQFSVKKIDVIPRQATFEFLCVTLASLSGPITVVAIYRPGSAHLDQVFFREFTLLLESIATFNSRVIIVGDLNVHLGNPDDIHAKQFTELLASFGLTQHVDSPTHNKGGILDLLITRSDCVVENLRVDPPIISDHGVISGTLPHPSPPGAVFTTRRVRGWKKLDHSAVRTALQSGPLCQASAAYDDMDASQLFDLYDSTLRSTLEEFVPIHTIKPRFQPSTPWFDDECRTIKRQVRMLERRYRRSGDPEDRLSWIEAARNKHRTFREKENLFWETAVASNSGNPSKLWRTVTSLLGVPSHSSTVQPAFSAEDFLGFMGRKVETVRADTNGAPPPVFGSVECSLSSFELSSEEDIRRIILSSPAKSCDLDPAPTFFVKDFLDCLLPFITRMCNVSLEESCLPPSQKKALITPRIRKPGLDRDDVSNYRPISNLTFISKVMEKIVAKQLIAYLASNNLMPRLQSGFRSGYSTETAILRVLSDIYTPPLTKARLPSSLCWM